VIVARIGLVVLGQTNVTEPVLTRCAELMNEIQNIPEADYLIEDDTFKDGKKA